MTTKLLLAVLTLAVTISVKATAAEVGDVITFEAPHGAKYFSGVACRENGSSCLMFNRLTRLRVVRVLPTLDGRGWLCVVLDRPPPLISPKDTPLFAEAEAHNCYWVRAPRGPSDSPPPLVS
jgi:hypothetical protein